MFSPISHSHPISASMGPERKAPENQILTSGHGFGKMCFNGAGAESSGKTA